MWQQMDLNFLDKCLENYGHLVFSKWTKPNNAIYIGRGSVYGNPFKMNSEQDREKVCLEYKEYLLNKIQKDKYFQNEVRKLNGCDVYCFCSNGTNSKEEGAKYCHGHVLLAIADFLEMRSK